MSKSSFAITPETAIFIAALAMMGLFFWAMWLLSSLAGGPGLLSSPLTPSIR
jgi:hypothetical protein